ncbi:calcium-independent phospholipase A2-gamma-like isoform X2 [Tachysurus vachellii]|uniref:calcium-independent phospholipase A2-gamma-like isoform X2 n=1 Tax=Tachysurus vachellii TaxID=175792 RepID=UPI00296AD565|nr:calcium-independent phospholipase A2-gamma-like isoform X2 [Tachysurus vachellii]
MGRYVSTNLGTTFGLQRLQLLYGIRNLLTSIRALSHLARTSCPIKPHRLYLNCHPSECNSGWNNFFKKSKQRPMRTTYPSLKHEAKLYNVQVSRMFSASKRETFKQEVPLRVKDTVQMQWMQIRFGDTFKRLSKHINMYFKQKEMSASCGTGQAVFVSVMQKPFIGVQRQAQTQNTTEGKEARELKQMQYPSISQSQESHLTSGYPGLQLFHMSSLVTRFGESYSYVASHINSVFLKQVYKEVPSSEDILGINRTIFKRVGKNQIKENMSQETGQTHYNEATLDVNNTDVCSSLEEGYLHFARHINRYFGAKVTDTVKESTHQQGKDSDRNTLVYSMDHQKSCAESRDTLPLRPKSLFHMSNLTTHFGENYAYMATHINHYFKSSTAADEHLERDPYSEQSGSTQEKQSSFLQGLLNHIGIQRPGRGYLGRASISPTTVDPALDRVAMRRQLAEDRTRFLLANLEKARARSSISSCVEDLNAHLILNPTCKSVVWQEKSAMHILKHCRLFWMDKKLQAAFRETLALIGYMDPLKGWGIRMLSIDGGGTRGVVPLQVLKQLEARTGKRVYQLFDYVCGVSTGAVLAFMLALAHFSIEECEEMYRRFGSDVFRQNPLVGTVKMGWSHSYYNTEKWEMILKEKIGDQLLVRTARDDRSPKVSAVSAVVNWGTSPKPFIFRNYNHSPGRLSRYAGGSGYQLWQAVRASSAAPGYFQEFPLYNDIHQDGGIILNNPCALAVHESRLLWPNQQFQCVLSLGTGRYDNARRGPATSTSLRAKISNLISSATDTEGVHTLLADLLEPNVYFRFNPMLSAEVSLDESRPSALKQLQLDTQQYLERNEAKMKLLCSVLGEERTTLGRTRDWISEKAWQLQQHWA